MQVLGLERDDVIISPFAVIVTVSSYGTTLLLTLFFLCGESSTTSLTGWKWLTHLSAGSIKDWKLSFSKRLLSSHFTRGGGSPIIFCLKEMKDEGMYCSFFAWPFVFEDSLKISSVFCGQKVVFMAQERLSSLALIHTCYLTYMNLKEVVDLFLRSTQGSSRAWHTIELQIMMMWCKLSE